MSDLRWWGWGTLDQEYSLENRPAFWPTLQEWLGLSDESAERECPPVDLEDVHLPPPRLDDPMIVSLRKLLGEKAVRTDRRARIQHAYGKSYCDLIRIRAGYVPNSPDAVVYPANQGQVASVIAWAADRDVTIIPFGGGSSVLGGLEPPTGDRPVITLDLAHLDRVLAIDPTSLTARIQAGIRGPALEAKLNEQGFTLGHFPQSFEFSTLGGWIATRAAGQTSIGYGRIEDMTQAIRVVTPAGIIETESALAATTGPSVREILIGSEGIYGVITEATMRVHPLPAVRDYRGFLFRNFEEGIAALQELIQHPVLNPTIIRLSDAAETAAYSAMAREHHGLSQLARKLLEEYVRLRGYAPGTGSALMVLGFDGDNRKAAQQWDLALEICADHPNLSLGRAGGRLWKRDRYAWPYLRDLLLDRCILVDTLDTTTTWSNLTSLYETTVGALKGAIAANGGGPGGVMTHITHASAQGASLRFTFLGRQLPTSDPLAKLAQWQGIKEAATEAILDAGGVLAHYGVGREHIPWLQEEIGQVGVKMLRSLKQTLDPNDTMNPGILLPPQE